MKNKKTKLILFLTLMLFMLSVTVFVGCTDALFGNGDIEITVLPIGAEITLTSSDGTVFERSGNVFRANNISKRRKQISIVSNQNADIPFNTYTFNIEVDDFVDGLYSRSVTLTPKVDNIAVELTVTPNRPEMQVDGLDATWRRTNNRFRAVIPREDFDKLDNTNIEISAEGFATRTISLDNDNTDAPFVFRSVRLGRAEDSHKTIFISNASNLHRDNVMVRSLSKDRPSPYNPSISIDYSTNTAQVEVVVDKDDYVEVFISDLNSNHFAIKYVADEVYFDDVFVTAQTDGNSGGQGQNTRRVRIDMSQDNYHNRRFYAVTDGEVQQLRIDWDWNQITGQHFEVVEVPLNFEEFYMSTTFGWDSHFKMQKFNLSQLPSILTPQHFDYIDDYGNVVNGDDAPFISINIRLFDIIAGETVEATPYWDSAGNEVNRVYGLSQIQNMFLPYSNEILLGDYFLSDNQPSIVELFLNYGRDHTEQIYLLPRDTGFDVRLNSLDFARFTITNYQIRHLTQEFMIVTVNIYDAVTDLLAMAGRQQTMVIWLEYIDTDNDVIVPRFTMAYEIPVRINLPGGISSGNNSGVWAEFMGTNPQFIRGDAWSQEWGVNWIDGHVRVLPNAAAVVRVIVNTWTQDGRGGGTQTLTGNLSFVDETSLRQFTSQWGGTRFGIVINVS